MLAIYTITANVGAVVTSALAGSAGQEGAISLLAFGVLGANMAVLTAAMLRLLYSASSDGPDGFLRA
jgi:hypothetical protein